MVYIFLNSTDNMSIFSYFKQERGLNKRDEMIILSIRGKIKKLIDLYIPQLTAECGELHVAVSSALTDEVKKEQAYKAGNINPPKKIIGMKIKDDEILRKQLIELRKSALKMINFTDTIIKDDGAMLQIDMMEYRERSRIPRRNNT